MYPLKFRPILKSVVWGGEKIAPFKEISTDQHNIGESWELSGVKGNESVIANGEYAGRTITDLVHEFKGKLIGEKNYEKTGDQFPLLIKFIDAKQDLSIQVHPDDKLAAARHNGSKGKTEMWYVVAADKDAHLMSGLTAEITPEEYEEKVNNHTITDVLHDYKVAPGDVFFLPAGRIHSIGSGSFIAEIQQTSDITYRIYDFGRLGLDGKPRELHTELATDAIHFEEEGPYALPVTAQKNEASVLKKCPYFTANLIDLNGELERNYVALDSFVIYMPFEGALTIEWDGGSERFRRGETILLPACIEEVRLKGEGKLLEIYIE